MPSRGASSKGRANFTPPAKINAGVDGELRVHVPIKSSTDILEARKLGREIASEMGFSSMDCTLIATAISELARNIVLYAQEGEIQLCSAMQTNSSGLNSEGIVIVACDQGPGIRDLRVALQDGFSTSRGLGLGLPGVKRIMDEFDIVSKLREGTMVTVKKWKP